MPRPLTLADLETAQCTQPDCDHSDHEGFILHGRCHIDAPTWVRYQPGTNYVSVVCAVCESLIAFIEVARAVEH